MGFAALSLDRINLRARKCHSSIRPTVDPAQDASWPSEQRSVGRGAWRDNIFVERIWRSIKYEEVYLHAYDSVALAKAGIARYIDFYNARRPHSSLDKRTPDEFYFAKLPAMKEAA